MKKIYVIIFLVFILFQLSPKGYEISIGGGYRLGYHYSYNFLDGFYQSINIPISLSYYPGHSNIVSIGFRNKFGYGITITKKDKQMKKANAHCEINFMETPIEHEIYNNLSFLLKLGKRVKFNLGLGCSIKYSFANIPDYALDISFDPYDPEFEFIFIVPDNYNYLSAGPTFDLGLEIQNKTGNFSFLVAAPFEFLIPVEKVKHAELYTLIEGNKLYTYGRIHEVTYINFTVGLECSFSFRFFKEIGKKK